MVSNTNIYDLDAYVSKCFGLRTTMILDSNRPECFQMLWTKNYYDIGLQ